MICVPLIRDSFQCSEISRPWYDLPLLREDLPTMAHELLAPRASMRRCSLRRIKERSRGFTLIELGVVVTIVGILAVIAVVAYRKMILNSKLTEAKTMINAIRVAEESYKAESGVYLDISAAYCPSDGMQQKKFSWENPTCASGKWSQLPVHADGPVQFGYAVYAANGGVTQHGLSTALIDISPVAANTDWHYIVHAKADLAGDGAPYSELAGSSFSGNIYTLNEGD
jgi:type IV pilus assembly protein PilA